MGMIIDFAQHLMAPLGELAHYAVSFIVMLTLLVFVHELGHYLIARRNGVRVDVFSIGFGPELFGWTSRAGTRWKFSAIPLGGYVKMFGDNDVASATAAAELSPEERAMAFPHKTVGQRAAIVVGGPAANFLFAIVVLAGLYMTVGEPYTPPIIENVEPGSAAAEAGFQPGDQVRTIDGQTIQRFEDMQRIVQARPGEQLSVTFERDGKPMSVTVTPKMRQFTDRFGNDQRIGLLGVRTSQLRVIRQDPPTALWQAARETWNLTTGTLHAVGQMIAGTRPADEIGGLPRIAKMAGDVTREGFVYSVWFVALLSINLGLINLFPIPVLDGGHLLFYAAEFVRGRPLGRRAQEYGSMAGLAAVLALMIFATWNDLVHLGVVARFLSLIS
ncbi:MAG TPA: RIP metalloprotease RseP [Candidatus Sulfotelmatobacter sp.]|nr:RIP metalloprotease RseP [Candidatus Sulfotelmatobacter sp.]